MPCYDSRNDTDYARQAWTHNSPVAQIACEAFKILEANGLVDKMSAGSLAWWEDHQEYDAVRAENDRNRK